MLPSDAKMRRPINDNIPVRDVMVDETAAGRVFAIAGWLGNAHPQFAGLACGALDVPGAYGMRSVTPSLRTSDRPGRGQVAQC
jgi:hypothetical protein